LKNKLFILGLIIVMTLTLLNACAEVIEEAVSGETPYGNGYNSNSPAGYYDDSLLAEENSSSDSSNPNTSGFDTDPEIGYVVNSHTDYDADGNVVVNGGDMAIYNTVDEPQEQIVPVIPVDNNSIRATRIRSTSTKIAVTFDDGPSIYTERILDVLEQHDSRATFFVVGSRLIRHRDIVLRTHEMGNEIANHSWSHPSFTRINDDRIRAELERTCSTIRYLLGYSPPFYRPPYGATNERVARVSGELGYAIIKWTLDPKDWRYRNANTIYNSVMSRVEGGSVILLHDIHATTAEATELLIPSLIEMGFELVTVSELLTYLYGELTPGRIYGMQVIE